MSVNGQAYILGDRATSLAHYPHARRAGPYIYVSGISSRRPDNTYEGSAKQVFGNLIFVRKPKPFFENIKAILKEAGASLDHLVDLTVFLVDMADYDGFNEIYNQYFDADTGPTRTTVAVKQLPCRPPNRLLIEIKAVALAP